MAVAFLANMAMAVAPVIKDALNACDISLQQLSLKFMAVADPRADNIHVSLFCFKLAPFGRAVRCWVLGTGCWVLGNGNSYTI
ncbi:hypothetical protein [Desulfobacter latus]|uniref:Uncharacterized protein n=1 Tax=Desulfobacter latus TaxID=2292 RepID=A0A850T7U8_9BACT|nr:hypothetical protein [Desulfobacter latus]NWH05175.1 hypothetical protein [Desulfobacter latus]